LHLLKGNLSGQPDRQAVIARWQFFFNALNSKEISFLAQPLQ